MLTALDERADPDRRCHARASMRAKQAHRVSSATSDAI
jgi:hypothetical protein